MGVTDPLTNSYVHMINKRRVCFAFMLKTCITGFEWDRVAEEMVVDFVPIRWIKWCSMN